MFINKEFIRFICHLDSVLKYSDSERTTNLKTCQSLSGRVCDGSSDRSFMVDPLSYFLFQPVLHDWFNKGCGMCHIVCGMMHIKEPLLLMGKSSPCGGTGFPL